MIKVIFLDIDGVLNSEDLAQRRVEERKKEYNAGLYTFIDEKAVKIVTDICEKYNVGLVISSSWRSTTVEQTKRDFSDPCYALLHPIIPYICGCTPKLGFSIDRGFEIEKYLMDNPDIKEYVILDDDSDMLECQENNFIQTSWLHGLTEEHVPEIKRILKLEDK